MNEYSDRYIDGVTDDEGIGGQRNSWIGDGQMN